MECQICFEAFDGKYFVPKILINCGHSFCKICLERLLNKKTSVSCPVCREQTYFYSLNERENVLPTNYSLIEIVDKSKHNEETKNVLEKYKYFDDKNYKNINSKIQRYYKPNVLSLKKIVNNDFIYVEEFENNQNSSIFSNYKERNRRYNFNKYSKLGWLFNEYSWSIWVYRKASKCNHEYSCFERFLTNIMYSACIGYFSKYVFELYYKHPFFKEKFNFQKDHQLFFQLFVGGLILLKRGLGCFLNFYIDDLHIFN